MITGVVSVVTTGRFLVPDISASGTMIKPAESTTLGWRPTCECLQDKLGELQNYVKGEDDKHKPKIVIAGVSKLREEYEPVPALVYDPFMGTGTVADVAYKLGRNYLGSELNESYVQEQCEPRLNKMALFKYLWITYLKE